MHTDDPLPGPSEGSDSVGVTAPRRENVEEPEQGDIEPSRGPGIEPSREGEIPDASPDGVEDDPEEEE